MVRTQQAIRNGLISVIGWFVLGGTVCAEDALTAGLSAWPDPATLSGPGIVPGQLSINLERQRRLWVSFVGYDTVTRVVTLRTLDRGDILTATVLPHAEIYVHAEHGSISDFRPYQTLLVRLHPDQDGKWRLATYLLDEFWHLSGHRQYQRIDSVAGDGSSMTCTVIAPQESQQPHAQAEIIQLTETTHYWRDGKQVASPALTPGLLVRCNTSGTAAGTLRIADDVVLDDASLDRCFIAPQRERQQLRLTSTGYPGYVQAASTHEITVLLFRDVAQSAEHAFAIGSTVRAHAQQWSGAAASSIVTATVLDTQRSGLGWQLQLRGIFMPSEWIPDRMAVISAPVVANP